MARHRNPIVQGLLSAASIGFGKGVSRLPLSWGRLAGRGMGRLAYHLIPRVKRVGLANLDLAYGPGLSRREKRRLLKKACENVGIVAAEFGRIPQLTGRFLEEQVAFQGLEHLEAGHGALLVGAHLGNWEWIAPALAARGFRVAAVARPLGQPKLNAFVDGTRRSGNFIPVFKHSAGREITRLLDEGWIVGLVVDQSPRENGVPVTFFGQPCWSTIAPGLIAKRIGAPVHSASMIRNADGRYVLKIHPEIPMARTGDSLKDMVENCQRCQDIIEALIREHPDQWLWLHRRWKPRPRLEQEWKERTARDEAPGPRA